MNKQLKRIATCTLSGLLLCQPIAIEGLNDFVIVAEAHPGRTDSNGGHHDNKNQSGLGSYHYHCGGNPAHLHDGGVCPYSSSTTTTSSSSDSKSASVDSGQSSGSSQSSTISTSGKAIKLSNGDKIDLSKDLIKIVQDVLNEKGYDCGTADGVVGTKTKDALSKFMKEHKDDEDNTDYMIISMIVAGLEIE